MLREVFLEITRNRKEKNYNIDRTKFLRGQ